VLVFRLVDLPGAAELFAEFLKMLTPPPASISSKKYGQRQVG
jgi:hypothetical protein